MVPDRSLMTGVWPRAVVFDLDGTLVDSTPDITAATNAALGPVGINATNAEVRGWLGDGARALIEKALRDHRIDCDEERVAALTDAFVAAYEANPVQDTTPFPDVLDALAELQKRGIRMAVCTNKPETVARQVLDVTGLARYMHTLAGGGRHALKPDPAGLLACIAELGASADDIVYIGDQAVDVTTARRAGVPVVVADFGYAAGAASELGADAVLPRWPELTACLNAMVAPEPPSN